MMRKSRTQPALMLSLLLCYSPACTKDVQVPGPVFPATACPLDRLPDFPQLKPRACNTTEVCMSSEDAVRIWEWARAVRRWAELATVCVDARA